MENLDNKYNELDKFFQDKLGNNVKIDDSWNVPPIDVLDNALGTINLNKKKRRKRYLLFLVLLFSTGLIFLVVRNSVNLHRIQQKVDLISKEQFNQNSNEILIPEKEQKIEPEKNKVYKEQQLNSSTINQTTQTEPEVSPNRNETEVESIKEKQRLDKVEVDKMLKNELPTTSNKPVSFKQKQPNQISNKNNQLTETSSKPKQSTEISKKQNDLNKNLKEKGIIKSASTKVKAFEKTGLDIELPNQSTQKISTPNLTKGLQTMPKQLKTFTTPLLPVIANALQNTENIQLISYQKYVLPVDNVDRKDIKFWTVYAFSGINFSKQRMTNVPLNKDFTLLDYDKSYVGLESGFGLQYQFAPKFNLNLSLGYSQINNESVYSDETAYISDNETINADGTITYKSDYSIQTTALAYESTYDFEVKDDNIKQMDNLTYIKQGCQNFKASVALEYSILSKNKFTVNLGAGGGGNYLIKAAQHLNINILNGNTSLYTNSDTLASTKEMNRLLLFGLGSASINYKISPKISLGLHNEYYFDLNSSRKIDNVNDPKTFNQGFRTLLTAGFRF